jgi:hypothetical protein
MDQHFGSKAKGPLGQVQMCQVQMWAPSLVAYNPSNPRPNVNYYGKKTLD